MMLTLHGEIFIMEEGSVNRKQNKYLHRQPKQEGENKVRTYPPLQLPALDKFQMRIFEKVTLMDKENL